MKKNFNKSVSTLAMAASMLVGATWSTTSRACPAEPILSSICIMAAAVPTNISGFHLADGSTMQVGQNQALFSLIGNTYGGDGKTTMGLPDLRGRVVLGTDPRTAAYSLGKSGGAASVTLTAAQLPAHLHTLTTPATPGSQGIVVTTGIGSLKVAMTGLTATTTMGTLAANTSLSGVTASAAASGLTLNGSTGTGTTLSNSPTGASLGTSVGSPGKSYSSTAPNTAMLPNSITGTLPVTFAGTPPTTTLTGVPATTIAGSPTLSGTPSVTIRGATDMTGTNTPAIATMPPYLALHYYIATLGMYPYSD